MANIAAAGIIATHLSDLLNTKIGTLEVHDEMFLIENSMQPKNNILNTYVKKIMKDYMTKK